MNDELEAMTRRAEIAEAELNKLRGMLDSVEDDAELYGTGWLQVTRSENGTFSYTKQSPGRVQLLVLPDEQEDGEE